MTSPKTIESCLCLQSILLISFFTCGKRELKFDRPVEAVRSAKRWARNAARIVDAAAKCSSNRRLERWYFSCSSRSKRVELDIFDCKPER